MATPSLCMRVSTNRTRRVTSSSRLRPGLRRQPSPFYCYLVSLQCPVRVLEEALLREGIPYRIYGGQRFYERLEIRNALAYLRLAQTRDDDPALERVLNTPPRGGSKTVENCERWPVLIKYRCGKPFIALANRAYSPQGH